MAVKDRAARALDITLDAATRRVGLHTEKVRAALAAYLDSAVKLRASTVRAFCEYLEMIAHH